MNYYILMVFKNTFDYYTFFKGDPNFPLITK